MKIKEKPEDFIVKELAEHEIKDSGEYVVFLLKKKNLNTLQALEMISSSIRIPMKRFGFAGTKDKRAVTEQYVSCLGVSKERLEQISVEGISIKFCGYKDEPISLGDLKGNYFKIVVRELTDKEIKKLKERQDYVFKNYFGTQRFSVNNHEVGKAIVKGDFKKACELIKGQENRYLKEVNGNDYVGAIKKVPLKLRKMFVHAYQSHMWNKVIDMVEADEVPLIGFGTEFKDKKVQEAYKKIMEEEQISFRDFIIRGMPELSVEGDIRKRLVEAKEFRYQTSGDFVTLEFELPKGSYATSVIEQIFR